MNTDHDHDHSHLDEMDLRVRALVQERAVPLARKGASTGAELARYAAAWDHAAHRTPHGRPIELGPDDLGVTAAR